MFKIFGKHYGTERFFILIFTSLALCIVTIGYSVHLKQQSMQTYLSGSAIYTQEYTWSRTGDKGKVIDVRSNSDGTGVFVLIQNGKESSTNASDYVVYMTGRDEPLVNMPSCTIYSYGSTGYIGLYFTDVIGFNNQVYSLIIRNDTEASIVADSSKFDPNAENDQSFIDHNQIRLYLNLGATGIQHLDVLDGEILYPEDVYAEIIRADEFEAIRTQLASQAYTMSEYQLDIVSNRQMLVEDDIVVPELPYYIANDTVNIYPMAEDEPRVFDIAMCDYHGTVDMDGTDYSGSFISNEDIASEDISTEELTSEDVATDSNANTEVSENQVAGGTYVDEQGNVRNYYYLHTDYLFPGRTNIDWQSATVSDDFLGQIDMTFAEYNAWYNEYSEQMYAEIMPTSISSNKEYNSWRYASTGMYVSLNSETGTIAERETANRITSYLSSVDMYVATKKQYCDTMHQIYVLQNDIDSVKDIITVNTSDSNFFTY